jgi:PTH1 family peptidyl-tRNA hydrolase
VKLIVGLGNPGREYEKTRHNAGFRAIDLLARRHMTPGTTPRSKFHAGIIDVLIDGEKCLLVQPTTYMNRSGMAVAEALRFYQLSPEEDLMVLVDDVALPCGLIRLRAGGSPGGHNGLRDIDQKLATSRYARCRIGVDPPGIVSQHDYVLGRFTPEQQPLVDEACDRACDAVECWLGHGITEAMNRFNQKATASPGTETSEGPDHD